MNTIERLQAYNHFDQDVLDAVSEAAVRQNTMSFADLAEHYDIDSNLVTFMPNGSDKPLEVLTLQPEGDYDETEASVYHTPMGNPVSPNQVMRAMRLFAADPTRQLIVVGNPAGPGSEAGRVSIGDTRTVIREKSLRPFAEPLIRQLGAQGVMAANHIGFSYGADKAATASHVSAEYGIETLNGVFVEPTSVSRQNIVSLFKRFIASGGQLDRYVQQATSEAYAEARSHESIIGLLGLLRVSNLAIAHTLASGGFEQRVRHALEAQPDMHVAIGWGTASELSDDQALTSSVSRLMDTYGRGRVKAPLRLEGMHHAGENDIDLHAAIVLQGLKR